MDEIEASYGAAGFATGPHFFFAYKFSPGGGGLIIRVTENFLAGARRETDKLRRTDTNFRSSYVATRRYTMTYRCTIRVHQLCTGMLWPKSMYVCPFARRRAYTLQILPSTSMLSLLPQAIISSSHANDVPSESRAFERVIRVRRRPFEGHRLHLFALPQS